MTKVYQVMSEGLSGPVTIVARDASDAFTNFWVWREKYAGDLQNEPAEVVGKRRRNPALTLAG